MSTPQSTSRSKIPEPVSKSSGVIRHVVPKRELPKYTPEDRFGSHPLYTAWHNAPNAKEVGVSLRTILDDKVARDRSFRHPLGDFDRKESGVPFDAIKKGKGSAAVGDECWMERRHAVHGISNFRGVSGHKGKLNERGCTKTEPPYALYTTT